MCAEVEVDDDAGRLVVTREPFGVVVAIVPWNAPLILSILKVAPALAAGNTVVVKPSPLAPLAVTLALRAIADTLPPGVLNVVHGDAEVGQAVVSHPLARKIAFTGGEPTAVSVARAAAVAVTPLVLELGGNDAAVFLDDVHLSPGLMERAVFGTFLTSGQVCMAAKRLYVPRPMLDDFVAAYREAADRILVVGDPLDPDVTMGPMVSGPSGSGSGPWWTMPGTGVPPSMTWAGSPTARTSDRGWYLRPHLVVGLRTTTHRWSRGAVRPGGAGAGLRRRRRGRGPGQRQRVRAGLLGVVSGRGPRLRRGPAPGGGHDLRQLPQPGRHVPAGAVRRHGSGPGTAGSSARRAWPSTSRPTPSTRPPRCARAGPAHRPTPTPGSPDPGRAGRS